MRYTKLILLLPILTLTLFAPTRHQAKPMRAAVLIPPVEYIAPTTTTSTSTTSTTLDVSRTTTTRANRGSPRQHPPVAVTAVPIRTQIAPSEHSEMFWKNLSLCENASGNAYGGYFQFTDVGTGRKAGYVPGSSYAEQENAAKRWAAIIHPREGTTAGWPHCWWVALAKGN